jgi:hypothetical protein
MGIWQRLRLYVFGDGAVIASDANGNIYHGAWGLVSEIERPLDLEDVAPDDIVFNIGRLVSKGHGEGFQATIQIGDEPGEFSYNGDELVPIDFALPYQQFEVVILDESGTPVADD